MERRNQPRSDSIEVHVAQIGSDERDLFGPLHMMFRTDRPSLTDKLLYTLTEAAYLLSLSKREVEELVQTEHLESGIAPGTKRARRVSRQQLRRYVQKLEGG